MNKPQKITPFKHFCLSVGVIPSAYTDAMSYYELLEWLCQFLQETVIPTVNNNSEVVTELQNLFVQLQNYVSNYFDNLDVQEEINNKLDEMAESGQLTDIIAQYLGLAGLLCYNTVADMKVAENLTNGSFTLTYGHDTYNDGKGGKFKVREVTNQDVVDNYNIIALADENLVAELIQDKYTVTSFNTVSEMLACPTLKEGMTAQTLGYYEANDGGAGEYVIIDNDALIDDGGLIHELANGLFAVLIVKNTLHSKQFGIKGDNTTDVTNKLNYFFTLPYNKIIDNGTYLINNTIFVKGTWNSSQTADKLTVKFEDCSFNYQGTAGSSSFIFYNTRHNIIDGLNIDITSNSNSVCIIGSYESTYNNFAIKNLKITTDDTLLTGKTFRTANIQHITFNNCIIRGSTTFDTTNENYYINCVNFNETMLNGNTTNSDDTATWVSDLVIINGNRFNENLNFINCDLSYSTSSIFAINTVQSGIYTNSLSKACINCNNCYFDSSVQLVKNYDNKNMSINLIECKMAGNNLTLNPSIFYKDYLKNTQISSSDVFPDHLPAGNMNLAYNGDMSTAGSYGDGNWLTGTDNSYMTKTYETSSKNIHNRCRQIVINHDVYIKVAMVKTPSEGIYTFGVRFMVTSGNANIRLIFGPNGEATNYVTITNNKEYFLTTNKGLQEYETNINIEPKIHITGGTDEAPITIQFYEVIVTPGKFILPNTPLHAGAILSEN